MIYESLFDRLKADAQIMTLTGGRLYFMAATSGQPYPDIVQYPSEGDMLSDTLEGTNPPWRRRISFECRATTYGDRPGAPGAHSLGDHVIRVLNNWTGVQGTEQIDMVQLVGDMTMVDETSGVRRRIVDFRVVHSPV